MDPSKNKRGMDESKVGLLPASGRTANKIRLNVFFLLVIIC